MGGDLNQDINQNQMDNELKRQKDDQFKKESIKSYYLEKRRYSSALEPSMPRKTSLTRKQRKTSSPNYLLNGVVSSGTSGKFVRNDKIQKYNT